MLEGYEGRFNTTLLERGPKEVVGLLFEREKRTCRTPASGDAVGEYCMIELEQRFGIVDGIRSDGLEGLESFLRRTENSFSSDEAVTCSWCTMVWFREKLGLWEEGKILNGSALSLLEYLTMWERAGRQCAGEQFDDVYNNATKFYAGKGLLGKQ